MARHSRIEAARCDRLGPGRRGSLGDGQMGTANATASTPGTASTQEQSYAHTLVFLLRSSAPTARCIGDLRQRSTSRPARPFGTRPAALSAAIKQGPDAAGRSGGTVRLRRAPDERPCGLSRRSMAVSIAMMMSTRPRAGQAPRSARRRKAFSFARPATAQRLPFCPRRQLDCRLV